MYLGSDTQRARTIMGDLIYLSALAFYCALYVAVDNNEQKKFEAFLKKQD